MIVSLHQRSPSARDDGGVTEHAAGHEHAPDASAQPELVLDDEVGEVVRQLSGDAADARL